MSAPKVLVTGCAGYVGSTLVGHLLAANYKVVGVDNLMYGNGSALLPHLGHPNFEFHLEDVQNWLPVQNLAQKCDVVMPLAALVGAPACDKDARTNEYAHSVNCWSIGPLVRSLSPYQLVVYPNTNSGYGSTDGSSYCTEEDPLTPISTYGWTKCEGEKRVLDHPRGVSLRLATVFGASPRMRLDLMVNDFAARLCPARLGVMPYAQDEPRLSVFEPNFKRNFVGVRDVARAFVHMAGWLRRGGSGGAYNLGLPTANLTKLELAHAVCDALHVSREAVSVGDGKDPDARNYLVSNDKILSTGFSFEHELAQGVREVAKVVATHTPEHLARMRNA